MKSKRPNNLFFVSGPHGSGKSTLITQLLKEIPNSLCPELETKTPQFYWGEKFVGEINFFHRQALKYTQRAIENYEYLMAARRFPNRLILGDRCIYDTQAYRAANVQLGQLTSEQDAEIGERLNILYTPELLNPFAVVLNPGFEICKNHLQRRWQETGWIKFMERDMDYLKAVCTAFSQLARNKRIFYIDKEIALPKDSILEKLKDWIVKSTGKKPKS